MEKEFKSGFAAIIGLPNVGKSTLLNAIAGQKIAIVSDKSQTTRNKILAIFNDEGHQIVFTDTPGIHRPHNKLGEFMVKTAKDAAGDVDIVLFMVDAEKKVSDTERKIAEDMQKSGIDTILVINKADKVVKEEILPIIASYAGVCDFAAVVPISAKTGDGVEILLDEMKKLLPKGPKFYDEELVTDQQEKQIAEEIIREKILRFLDKEVPHGIAVQIEKMSELDNITKIYASIYCEKASHKGIIIGKNGEMLKKIGKCARVDIEEMLDKKVYLELWVKVKNDWRNSEKLIKNFGFDL
ncbi:MAG TPA: GTPase Era [Clostridiales bacterium]|nr:GTPase Era [Clostridiales bacterium]